MAEIKFFGEIDIHPTRKTINSEYPAWYFDRAVDNLEEDILKTERIAEDSSIPADKRLMVQERLGQMKEKYRKIMDSMPKLDGKGVDELTKARRAMEKEIRPGLFSRSSMEKGTADAHKEAERMIKPKIDVKPEYADVLKAANVDVRSGKVTRDQMIKAWKIAGKLINRHGGDEDTNAEVLRKD